MRNIALLVFALIFSLSLPSGADAASDLPAGFVALSESRMTWDEANAFCKQQKGKLPLINNAPTEKDNYNIERHSIDGFGKYGSPWPSGLDEGDYWTGTDEGQANKVWHVYAYGGKVDLGGGGPWETYRALCVK